MGINSPMPVKLQEETRKAAKIMRSFANTHNNGIDKVVPQSVLERAAGFAIFTVIKAGFLLSARAGAGVVIARTPDGGWSPPSAIGLGGVGFGGQMGAEVTDFLVVLNSPAAVKSFMAAGSLTLGGNLSVAVGPLGRNAEGTGALSTKGRMAAMYSYSKTRGLFGGISVEGSVIVERQDANRIAYGGNPTAKQILSGTFDPPDWAMVLVDEIEKCTGLPGGRKWRSWDEEGEGEGGGMGWSSPGPGDRGRGGGGSGSGSGGGGYVFGEGVGASGSEFTETSGRKRGASLSIFDRSSKSDAPSSAGIGPSGSAGNSPARPSLSKRTSSFNPFSTSNASPSSPSSKRSQPPGMASSENYNAGLTWDSDGPQTPWATRPRAGSSGLRPAHLQEGRARSYSDPKARRGGQLDSLGEIDDYSAHGNGGGRGGGSGSGSGNGVALGEPFGRMDLNGQRNGHGHGHARYGSTSGTPNRSRANSRLADDGYVPYETVSSFGQTGRLRDQPDELDPFGEGSATGAFSQYHKSHSSSSSPSRGSRTPAFRAVASGATPVKSTSSTGTGGGGLASSASSVNLGPSETGYARTVALFDLAASATGDLALKKGQVVFAMDKVGTGEWWRGMNVNGDSGIFPANYVEVLEIPQKLKGGVSRGDLKKRVLDLDLEF